MNIKNRVKNLFGIKIISIQLTLYVNNKDKKIFKKYNSMV